MCGGHHSYALFQHSPFDGIDPECESPGRYSVLSSRFKNALSRNMSRGQRRMDAVSTFSFVDAYNFLQRCHFLMLLFGQVDSCGRVPGTGFTVRWKYLTSREINIRDIKDHGDGYVVDSPDTDFDREVAKTDVEEHLPLPYSCRFVAVFRSSGDARLTCWCNDWKTKILATQLSPSPV